MDLTHHQWLNQFLNMTHVSSPESRHNFELQLQPSKCPFCPDISDPFVKHAKSLLVDRNGLESEINSNGGDIAFGRKAEERCENC